MNHYQIYLKATTLAFICFGVFVLGFSVFAQIWNGPNANPPEGNVVPPSVVNLGTAYSQQFGGGSPGWKICPEGYVLTGINNYGFSGDYHIQGIYCRELE